MARPIVVLAALAFVAFQAPAPDPIRPDPDAPRPIPARDTVFMEDMTWMEVRDAMRAGKDTAIVATGGIEQNGPYLAAGKHNVVLRATTEAIARKLGDALVAPIVPFVPEGDIDPPTEHMRYPSTISVTEGTYRALLAEICACLRTHGFRRIVLIGDSGGNQKGMEAVANDLNAKWSGGKTKDLLHQGVLQLSRGGEVAGDPGHQADPRGPARRLRDHGADGGGGPEQRAGGGADQGREVPDQRRGPGPGREDGRLGPEDRRLPGGGHDRGPAAGDGSGEVTRR